MASTGSPFPPPTPSDPSSSSSSSTTTALFRARVARSSDRVVAGVAAGWAERWGVEPTVVRAALGLLSLVGGLGLVLYGLMAMASDPAPPVTDPLPPARRRDPVTATRRELSIISATAAVLVLAREIGLWPGDLTMISASLVALGVVVVWSRGRRSSAEPGPGLPPVARSVQVLAGTFLLAAGVVSLASRTGGLANVGASASAIAVVVGGLVIFLAPGLGRLLRSLDDERAMRIREDERAAVAAHLHDSVLQSLVLIQRSDDPRAMAALARRQERELRAWLYGTPPTDAPRSLHAALAALTTEIEADHDLRVEAVVVGDQPLDEPSTALLAALREAIVNAARHASVERVDVFVEADDAELTGFVRDTGKGFDPQLVPADRRGIAESIVGRIRRIGGTATVVSSSGAGTEVEIRIPRPRT